MIQPLRLMRMSRFQLVIPELVNQNIVAAARFDGAWFAQRSLNFRKSDLIQRLAFVHRGTEIADIVYNFAASDAEGIRPPAAPGE